MLPLGPRYAVARAVGTHYSPGGILLQAPDGRHSHVGTIIATGRRAKAAELPLELRVGEQVLYSSRVDTFEVEGFAVPIDVVEEASVIAAI